MKANEKPVIGILGGGQLAKMLTTAALPFGFRIRILAPSESAIIPEIYPHATIGDWSKREILARFSEDLDALTVENEFVPLHALEGVKAACPLRPSIHTLGLIQDKFVQKETLREANLPLPPFRNTPKKQDAIAFGEEQGWPIVLKRRSMGYDGKGNYTVNGVDEIEKAWDFLGGDNTSYAEAFCRFDSEMAVMVTRGADGSVMTYPVTDTVQKNHICHTVTVPCGADDAVRNEAAMIAEKAVTAIEAVGTVGVELFRMPDNTILVNEMAPRVHNSGHYTIEACECSQFENHIRAVLGMPLGRPAMKAPAAAMVNLLADEDGPGYPDGVRQAMAIQGAHIHIYGKTQSVKGRKMGHVTALGESVEEALETARKASSLLRFGTTQG